MVQLCRALLRDIEDPRQIGFADALPSCSSACRGRHPTPGAAHSRRVRAPHPVRLGRSRACGRLEEAFEADAADASRRLLLVHDWPLTGVRDAPIAYLQRPRSWARSSLTATGRWRTTSDGTAATPPGPSRAAVIAALAHLVAKLEAEQAAQPRHYQTRFTAGGSLVDGPADLEAARELVHIAFPFLPGDGDGEPQVASVTVQEQRRTQRAKRGRARPSRRSGPSGPRRICVRVTCVGLPAGSESSSCWRRCCPLCAGRCCDWTCCVDARAAKRCGRVCSARWSRWVRRVWA